MSHYNDYRTVGELRIEEFERMVRSIVDSQIPSRDGEGSSLDRSLSIGNIMKALYGEDYAQTQVTTQESQSHKETHGRGVDVVSGIAGMFGERSRRDEDEQIGQKKGRGMHI